MRPVPWTAIAVLLLLTSAPAAAQHRPRGFGSGRNGFSAVTAGGPAGYSLIPAGSYTMGVGGNAGSYPDVAVTLTRDFWMKNNEITQGEWKALSGGTNPSCFQTAGSSSCTTANANDSAPVEQVSWWSALGYLNALSTAQGLTECFVLPGGCTGTWQAGTLSCGDAMPALGGGAASIYACTGYRLPTEAEWERAARGGTTTDTYAGDFTGAAADIAITNQPVGYTDVTVLSQIAWFSVNSGSRPRVPAGLRVNQYGLFDALGNIQEWNWNAWSPTTPGGTDPAGPGTSTLRPYRGGGHGTTALNCHVARRVGFTPSGRGNAIGLRPVRTR